MRRMNGGEYVDLVATFHHRAGVETGFQVDLGCVGVSARWSMSSSYGERDPFRQRRISDLESVPVRSAVHTRSDSRDRAGRLPLSG